MTGPGGTNLSQSQACAACKHQRRKCAPDCALAPYFPPHRQTEFLNVHRLFGVRNIINTVKNVDPDQCEIAVSSMIQEANLRVLDPVEGSCGIVKNLHDRCNQIKVELDLVLQQLAICRAAQTKGDNNEIQSNIRNFYDDISVQNCGNVPLHSQPVDKASKNISSDRSRIFIEEGPKYAGSLSHNNIQTAKKASTSGKDEGVEPLQIVPYENKGALKKGFNIDENDEFPAEMKENDMDNQL